MPELIVTYEDGRTQRHLLTRKPQDVGRDPTCYVQIDDPTVSRRHADIRGDAAGTFTVRDLGSKNGTLVNNVHVTARELKHGDEIVFGSVPSRFHAVHDTPTHSSITLADQPTLSPQSVSYADRTNKLQLSYQRLQSIYEISDRLTGLRDRSELLHDIMRICIDTFEFERAAIAIKRSDGRAVDWPVVHNLQGLDGEIRISRNILRQALHEGQRAVFSDTDMKTMDPTQSIVQQGTRSAMCVPISYSDKILGVIYGDRISSKRDYDQEDVDFLAAMARQASIGLTNAQLLEQQQQRILLEGEIAIARQIQSGLFPETLEVHPRLQISAINEPGRQVSGDYYDVIPMSDGRVGLVVADVTGKGVASALLAANIQAGIRLLLPDTTDLAALANKLNVLVYQNTDSSRFITAVIAAIDPRDRSISFVSAGHSNPIKITQGMQAAVIDGEGNLPFGIAPDESYRCLRAGLGPQPATCFLYTDGLNEALNEREEQYGLARLLQMLGQQADRDPDHLLLEVRRNLADYCGDQAQSDDITLIAARMNC